MNKLLSVLLFPLVLFAQDYIFQGEIGTFRNASSFTRSPQGYFFICDSETNEIYKTDSTGVVVKQAGGFGWDEGLFDFPSSVFANTLNVYVCDYNNHRLQIFDKDLNYLSSFKTKDGSSDAARFGYPLSCCVSGTGDIYILDGENKRIIKFNLRGEYQLNFGGYDAGRFSLSDPLFICMPYEGIVASGGGGDISVFDQFGAGIAQNKTEYKFINGISAGGSCILNSNGELFTVSVHSNEMLINKINITDSPEGQKIKGGIISGDRLYVLYQNCIGLYAKKKAE